jgi:predicted metallo-beta-lactamase superfamily hydrolase
MLKFLQVTPLAAESLGVRSMCTYVETPDARILLDAGVSLCPRRFGLPPHPKEFEAIVRSRERIAEAADKAEVVTISHYHNDHHTPSFEDWLCNWTSYSTTAKQIYEGKTVLMKDSRENINYSQRERAWMFQKTAGKHAYKLEVADGRTFEFGGTRVSFCDPVFHGPENSELGWVLATSIAYEDEKFMFAPDVQGPMASTTLRMIVEETPQLLLIGGPPLYLEGLKVWKAEIRLALKNLVAIAERVPQTLLEHHILRDRNWREKATRVFQAAHRTGHLVQTSAEYLGKRNCLLETDRKELFDAEPPSKDFESWMRLEEDARRLTKPPIGIARRT